MTTKDDAMKGALIIAALLIIVLGSLLATRVVAEQEAKVWQNTTAWQAEQTTISISNQISNLIIVQGYVPWCVKAQNGNNTYCGYLIAQNFTEVSA
jgi:hypothetical protein